MVLLPLLASAAVVGSADYPVEPVWEAYISFCPSHDGPPPTWSEIVPEPETSLAYLAEDPSWRFGGKEGEPATVYRTEVEGRTLFAFKRHIDQIEQGYRLTQCRVYDFEATARLAPDAWAQVAGPLSAVDQREFTQRFDFKGANSPHQPEGKVELRQAGAFPNPDTVGFTGLNIVAISRTSL